MLSNGNSVLESLWGYSFREGDLWKERARPTVLGTIHWASRNRLGALVRMTHSGAIRNAPFAALIGEAALRSPLLSGSSDQAAV